MKKRQKYTYVPKDAIENIVTTNSSFTGDEILDGVYLKGRKKFKKGGKPKAPKPKEKTIQKMSNKVVARKIMELDNQIWEDLNIESGSQLRADKALQQKYIDKMSEADKLMAKAKDPKVVMDILEDENYHSTWGYFHFGGKELYYADGGQTPSRRMRSINARAQELVGEEVWEDLSMSDQADLVADYVAEGVLAVPLADGGHLVRKRSMNEFEPSIRKKGDEYIVYSKTHGIQRFDSKEKAEDFTQKVKKDVMMLAANIDEDFYGYEHGGQMMAKGAEVAEATSFTVSWEIGGKKKEKKFDDKEKAQAYMEILGDDDEITKIEIKESAPKKASAPAFNLFQPAMAQTKKSSASKKERGEVIVPGLASTIARFDELKEIIKNAEAEKEILDGQLKEIGKDKFIQMYEEQGFRPKNFNLADGDEKVMYVMSDNYRGSRFGVSTEKAEMLEPYDVLESETTYTFENDILNKPGVGEAISRMIMQSKVLSEEDKRGLIKATTKTIVKKGTIDRLLQFDNPAMIFDLIEPVVSLR